MMNSLKSQIAQALDQSPKSHLDNFKHSCFLYDLRSMLHGYENFQ